MLKVRKAEALFRLVAAWFGGAAGVYVQIFVMLVVMCMLLYAVWTKLKVNLGARVFPYVRPSAYIISEIRNFDCICNLWVWNKICLPRLVLDSFGRDLTTFYLKLKYEFVDLFLSWTAHLEKELIRELNVILYNTQMLVGTLVGWWVIICCEGILSLMGYSWICVLLRPLPW